ncbi:MAG: hypothetical protein OXJ53_10410, partial [Gammaproteobacteria bacterium]|nr:hypothetical protein [Gammaproteobacteria bacterium]MDE0271704.1 hypothetical protein [Gammaproteobacteria bacterium]
VPAAAVDPMPANMTYAKAASYRTAYTTVCAAFPLERAVDAMRMLENRSVVGKCVVTMNGYEFEGA